MIGGDPFVLQITDPGKPPSFIGSEANLFLSRSLASSQAVANETFPFAEALLESTYAINTLAQLAAKKNN